MALFLYTACRKRLLKLGAGCANESGFVFNASTSVFQLPQCVARGLTVRVCHLQNVR